MDKKIKTISFKISSLEDQKLQKILKQTNQSQSDFFREKITEYILNDSINEIETHLETLEYQKEKIKKEIQEEQSFIALLYRPLKEAANYLDEVHENHFKKENLEIIGERRTNINFLKSKLSAIEKELMRFKKIFIEKKYVQNSILNSLDYKESLPNRSILLQIAGEYKKNNEIPYITNFPDFKFFIQNHPLIKNMIRKEPKESHSFEELFEEFY